MPKLDCRTINITLLTERKTDDSSNINRNLKVHAKGDELNKIRAFVNTRAPFCQRAFD